MVLYTYQGIDGRGRRVCGHRHVSGYDEIKRYLEQKGYAECKIYASKTAFSKTPFKYASPRELSLFFMGMAAVFASEKDDLSAMELLAARQNNGQLKVALREICDISRKGIAPLEAMEMYGHLFTNFALEIIHSASENDTLDFALRELAARFGREAKNRAKMRTAVFYPLLSFGLTAVLCLVILTRVFPLFRGLADSIGALSAAPAAPNMKPALSLSNAETLNKILLTSVIVIAVVLFAVLTAFVNTRKGRLAFDRIKARLPFIKRVTTRAAAAEYLRGLAALVKSGAPFANALEDARLIVMNRYLSEKLAGIVRRVKQGVTLDKALDELRPLPEELGHALYVGYASGQGGDLFDAAAAAFEAEADEATERIYRVFEPALAVIAGLVLCAVLASVILPMVNIVNTF